MSCSCEFDNEDGEDWHYKRECCNCGNVWYGLHCEHDLIQNPCGKCGSVPAPVEIIEEF